MLEETLEKIFNQLGRVADATEDIAKHLSNDRVSYQIVTPDAPPPAAEAPAKKKKAKAEPAEPAEPLVGPKTESAIREALKLVLDRKGWETAEKLLAEFKVKQVKSLKVEDYPKVIARCQEVLNGKAEK